MRVLHITYEYPNVTTNCGGGGAVVQTLHESLQARGLESGVLTDDADGHYATFPARSLYRLNERIKQTRPDVLHGHFSLPSSLLLPAVSERHGIPYVVTTMGADVYDPTRFSSIRPLTSRLNEWVLEGADAVVAPSTDLRDRIESRWSVSARHIPHGIDPGRYPWLGRGKATSPTILTVCRLVERKNLDAAIHGVRRYRERHGRDVTYRIVGTGPEGERLREKYDYDWLTLPGYVDDLKDELYTSDAFLLPSQHEAFGVSILEALSAGLPVVTSNTGGQTDIVTSPVGRTVDPTMYGVCNGLRQVFDNWHAMHLETKDFVEMHYSASRMANDYADLYQQVVS